MLLTWLAEAARTTGYKVIEVPGWQNRGHGQMRGAHGVVGHWTAGPKRTSTTSNYPSLGVVRDGRPGLDGPLAQLGIGFDGSIYVIAAGICWHAGASTWRGENNLNYTYVGIEAESPGNYIWTPAQADVYPRLCAALLKHMGRSAQYIAGHREVATPRGRKTDAPSANMDGFRNQVQGLLDHPNKIKKIILPTTKPIKPKPPVKPTAPVKPIPPIVREEDELNVDEKEQLRKVEARTLYLQELVETLQDVVFKLAAKNEITDIPAKVTYRADGKYPTN